MGKIWVYAGIKLVQGNLLLLVRGRFNSDENVWSWWLYAKRAKNTTVSTVRTTCKVIFTGIRSPAFSGDKLGEWKTAWLTWLLKVEFVTIT